MALSPEFQRHLRDLEQQYNLPPGDLFATAEIESNFNPRARSPVGAEGMFQFMPETWAPYAKKHKLTDPYDPFQQAVAAADHRGELYAKYGKPDLVSAAYNAGSGAVDKYGGVPPYKETQNYIPKYFNARNHWEYDTGPSPANLSTNAPATTGATEEAPQKSNFTKKILPLLLRFALPTVTGAMLGARNPFMGAAAGGLMGLSGAGLGHLNAQAKQDMFDQELGYKKNKALADLSLANNKMSSDAYWKGKNYDLANSKYQSGLADQTADNERANTDLQSKLKYREAMAAAKKSGVAGEKNPKENLLKLLSKQFNGQPIDPNNEEAKQLFISNLSSQNEPIVSDEWFGDDLNDDVINDYIKSYNQYVTRGQPASASGGKKIDATIAKEFLRQAGGDKNKAREMARQAGYSF